eukprot:m.158716 g.158716  ORF g.158716 m.158716 type:complete len:251 (-) comp17028_c1_seq2:1592-2344(-)
MAASTSHVSAALAAVRQRVLLAYQRAAAAGTRFPHEPELIAVSKTKPVEAVLEAHAAGQRVFGENYVQELAEKAVDARIPQDVKWHFIGHLQKNKCNIIAGVPNLACVQTISDAALATKLDNALSKVGRQDPLCVMVQVNTSREENKHGVLPAQVEDVAKHIVSTCPHLKLTGVMTIGEADRVLAEGEANPDFLELVACRERLAAALQVPAESLELSMGMSADYEQAISCGSTFVRVGSSIFGARDYGKH